MPKLKFLIRELCQAVDTWNEHTDEIQCFCDFVDPFICDCKDESSSCKCQCHYDRKLFDILDDSSNSDVFNDMCKTYQLHPKFKVSKRCKSCIFHANLIKQEYKKLRRKTPPFVSNTTRITTGEY